MGGGRSESKGVRRLLERTLFPARDDVWWEDAAPPSEILDRIGNQTTSARFGDRFAWPGASQPMFGQVNGNRVVVTPAHRFVPYAEVPEFRGHCYVASDGRTYVRGSGSYPFGWFPKVWLGGVSLFLVVMVGLALIEAVIGPIGTRTGTWAAWIGIPAAMLAAGLALFAARRRAAATLRSRLLAFLARSGTNGSVLVVNGQPYEPGGGDW